MTPNNHVQRLVRLFQITLLASGLACLAVAVLIFLVLDGNWWVFLSVPLTVLGTLWLAPVFLAGPIKKYGPYVHLMWLQERFGSSLKATGKFMVVWMPLMVAVKALDWLP